MKCCFRIIIQREEGAKKCKNFENKFASYIQRLKFYNLFQHFLDPPPLHTRTTNSNDSKNDCFDKKIFNFMQSSEKSFKAEISIFLNFNFNQRNIFEKLKNLIDFIKICAIFVILCSFSKFVLFVPGKHPVEAHITS